MRTPSPSSEPPPQKYRWFRADNGSYTNKSDQLWIVVVGCDVITPIVGVTGILAIQDGPAAKVIDRQRIDLQTAVGEGFEGLVRRMLCPPKGNIAGPDTTISMSLVECATLEDALAIL